MQTGTPIEWQPTDRAMEEGPVSIRFNHTIVYCRDRKRSSAFMAEVLGLPEPADFGHFKIVELENEAELAFLEAGAREIESQHYAFLIGEDDFDPIFGRIRERGLEYWADPFKQRSGEINHNDGGRGVYFEDPDGHLLEVLTRPYGSGASGG